MTHSLDSVRKAIKSLPPEAQKTITRIRFEERQADAEAEGRYSARMALNQRRIELQAIIAQYRSDNMPESYFAEELLELEETKRQLQDFASSSVPSPSPNSETLAKWLRKMQERGTKFEHFAPDVRIPKGRNALEALEEQRASIQPMYSELEAVNKAQLTVEEAEARAISDINRLAASGAPDFRQTARLEEIGAKGVSQGGVIWPEKLVGDRFTGNGMAFTAWLFKDELIARAKKEIRAFVRPSALSLQDRRKRRIEIKSQIVEAERVEEVLFRKAVDAGAKITRRPNVNMLAVLQLREVA